MDKDTERRYMNAFVGLRADLDLTDVRGSERPDFLCSVKGVATGIEMTRFFFPSSDRVPPQAVNGYRDQMCYSLREEHLRRGMPPLHASVSLRSDEKILASSTRKLLVISLVDFVQQNIPPIGPHMEFEDLPSSLTDLGVNRVSVIRAAALTRPTWAFPYSSYIPESHSALIQSIITEKSSLVAEYRKQAPVLWLLIVSGTNGLHSIIDFDRDVLTASYTSNFDRMFLFQAFGSAVHELKRTE